MKLSEALEHQNKMKLFVIAVGEPCGTSYFAAKSESDIPPTDNFDGWWVWSKHDAEQLAVKNKLTLICDYPEWNPNKSINPHNKNRN